MCPWSFELFGLRISLYGVFLVVALFTGYHLSLKFAKDEGIGEREAENTITLGVIFAIIFARLFYVTEHYGREIKGFFDAIALWRGGVDWFGAFTGGVLGVALGIYLYKLPLWSVADVGGLVLPLAHAIGRLGCTSVGCCYGKRVYGVKDLSVGIHPMDKFPYFYVVYPEGSIAPPGVPLYPTQILEFFGNLLIFLVLLLLYKRFRPFKGFIFSSYLMLYGLERFLLEFLRGVTPANFFGLTWNQIFSLGLILTSIMLTLSLYAGSGKGLFRK